MPPRGLLAVWLDDCDRQREPLIWPLFGLRPGAELFISLVSTRARACFDSGQYMVKNNHPGPSTGSLKTPVWTVIPFQMTSRGSPTLTELTCTSVPPHVTAIRRGPRQGAAPR